MIKTLIVFLIIGCSSAFAQNMADTESYRDAYTENPDGTSRYIGNCTTHEDYQDVTFLKGALIQKYVVPYELSDKEVKEMIAKFDRDLFVQILSTLDMYNMAEGQSEVSIMKEFFDDFEAEKISHTTIPGLNLIRISFGVGGGNGGYLVFNKTQKGSESAYELMSYTFDGDLNYCDLKVWKK